MDRIIHVVEAGPTGEGDAYAVGELTTEQRLAGLEATIAGQVQVISYLSRRLATLESVIGGVSAVTAVLMQADELAQDLDAARENQGPR